MSPLEPPAAFEWVRDGRLRLLVRSDARSWLVPLLHAAATGWTGYTTHPLATGRGGARVVHTSAETVVVRPCRRGGLPAWVMHDTYFGWRPRPFREVCTAEVLRQRGAPVVETYGAAVRWLVPGCYRGWVVTRYLAGAQTFWEWARARPAAFDRQRILRGIGYAVRQLHTSGGHHPDLNVSNILIAAAADTTRPPDVRLIDFDRAGETMRSPRAELDRLRRSARKVDPQGEFITPADLEVLQQAYEEPHARDG